MTWSPRLSFGKVTLTAPSWRVAVAIGRVPSKMLTVPVGVTPLAVTLIEKVTVCLPTTMNRSNEPLVVDDSFAIVTSADVAEAGS